MSVANTSPFASFTIASLPATLAIPFPANSVSDLAVADGAALLTLGSDYSLASGFGYNAQNQMLTGSITVVAGGAGNVQVGDVISVSLNVTPNQTTTFASTGDQTPLMIEADDDKLTQLVKQVQTQNYFPWAPVSGSQTFIPLGWITAETGGGKTDLDAVNVNGIPLIQLPLFVAISVLDDFEIWKLRPMAGGDPSGSIAGAFVVPVSNANNLIWVRVL